MDSVPWWDPEVLVEVTRRRGLGWEGHGWGRRQPSVLQGGLGLRGGAEWGEMECVVVAGGELGGRGGGEGRPGFSGKIDEPGERQRREHCLGEGVEEGQAEGFI